MPLSRYNQTKSLGATAINLLVSIGLLVLALPSKVPMVIVAAPTGPQTSRRPTPRPTSKRPTKRPTVPTSSTRPSSMPTSRRPTSRRPTSSPTSRRPTSSPTSIANVRSEIEKLVMETNRTVIPGFIRLGFHDCVGGCDGCVDLANGSNNGLDEAMEAIYPLVKKFQGSYSRADVWAMAALVSADLASINGRPEGLSYPMTYIGRKDCKDADAKGNGGADVVLPSNLLTTHEVLLFFKDNFGFTTEETVIIMGMHSVGSVSRDNSGFGNIGRDDGWVFNATDRIMDNRWYKMLVGDGSDPVNSAPNWTIELVVNDGTIPDRYQWFHEEKGIAERPVMLNADMALVRDLSNYMHPDENGIQGAVDCVFQGISAVPSKVVCPIASDTIDLVIQFKNDNESWLLKLEKVFDKMLRNGYPASSPKPTAATTTKTSGLFN